MAFASANNERAVRVEVPATTANLGPGYDCLGLALGLRNRLVLSLAEDVRVDIVGEGASTLPRDRSHLCLRAADALAARFGRKPPGWRLRQENAIPLARGLGSSSAAVVGGLVACNELLGLGASQRELLRLAAQIEGHPDNVAPALLGGLTVCCADDSDVECISVPLPERLLAVLVIPEFEVSTVLARHALPQVVSHADAAFNTAHAALTVAALLSGRLDSLGRAMCDRLHQPYRAHLVPGMEQALAAALAAGALGAALSGSGPTLIALATEADERIGAAMQQALAAAGVRSDVMVLPLSATGARVVV